MRKTLTIVAGFAHDLATGAWAATVLGVWYLAAQPVSAEVAAVLQGLERRLFAAGLICIAVVMATGASRMFTYVPDVFGEGAERDRRRLLIAKHVILGLLFMVGTWWQHHLAWAAR